MTRAIDLLTTLRARKQAAPSSVPQGHQEVRMHRIATAVLCAGFLLPSAPARASLTVTPGLTVSNRCNRDITIAVHYKDRHGNWTTTSFTNIRARGQKETMAFSIYYLF